MTLNGIKCLSLLDMTLSNFKLQNDIPVLIDGELKLTQITVELNYKIKIQNTYSRPTLPHLHRMLDIFYELT